MSIRPRPLTDFTVPQAKIGPRYPTRIRYQPDEFPLPHYLIGRHLYMSPDFAPVPPPRGFWLYHELPRVKLRGLSPTDSLILRAAFARGVIHPACFYLAPLIPYHPAHDEPLGPGQTSRNLTRCPDAPWQPDGGWDPDDPEPDVLV